jgi:hypothetical protein
MHAGECDGAPKVAALRGLLAESWTGYDYLHNTQMLVQTYIWP